MTVDYGIADNKRQCNASERNGVKKLVWQLESNKAFTTANRLRPDCGRFDFLSGSQSDDTQ